MRWVKSSFCADRTCVEAAPDGDRVLVRDGKNPDGTVLDFSRDEWNAFLDAIQSGELDNPVDQLGGGLQ